MHCRKHYGKRTNSVLILEDFIEIKMEEFIGEEDLLNNVRRNVNHKVAPPLVIIIMDVCFLQVY